MRQADLSVGAGQGAPDSSDVREPKKAAATARKAGAPARKAEAMARLAADVVGCTRCPRLIEHSRRTAEVKRRAYADWDYWGKPLAGFGDPDARLLVVGMAPAAHGGNRTGRVFTGNGSADWVVTALHAFGFANQGKSIHKDDGLRLTGAYMANAARCAPPANRPTADELRNCQPFLERELQLLANLRVVIVLGQIAFNAFWNVIATRYAGKVGKRPKFGHNLRYDLPDGGPTLLVSYHPSRQNTQTGRLTKAMFHDVFALGHSIINGEEAAGGEMPAVGR